MKRIRILLALFVLIFSFSVTSYALCHDELLFNTDTGWDIWEYHIGSPSTVYRFDESILSLTDAQKQLFVKAINKWNGVTNYSLDPPASEDILISMSHSADSPNYIRISANDSGDPLDKKLYDTEEHSYWSAMTRHPERNSEGLVTQWTMHIRKELFSQNTTYSDHRIINLIAHEIGHVYGLDHYYENGSDSNSMNIMNHTSGNVRYIRDIERIAMQVVTHQHTHTDSFEILESTHPNYATSHKAVCSSCKTYRYEAHTYTHPCQTKCDNCDYVRTGTAAHTLNTLYVIYSATQHRQYCTVCQEGTTPVNHTMVSAMPNPAYCSVCHYSAGVENAVSILNPLVSNSPGTVFLTWQPYMGSFMCNVRSYELWLKTPGETEFSLHYTSTLPNSTLSANFQTTVAGNYQYYFRYLIIETGEWKTTAIQTHVLSMPHTHTWGAWQVYTADSTKHIRYCTDTACGMSDTPQAHGYDHACDSTCNVCGATRTVTHSYNCGGVCIVCGQTGGTPSGTHTYTNACDSTCNVCGATRTVTHSYNCGGVCIVCGQTGGPVSHSYPAQWEIYNSVQHRRKCTQCTVYEYGSHSSSASCTVCAYADYNLTLMCASSFCQNKIGAVSGFADANIYRFASSITNPAGTETWLGEDTDGNSSYTSPGSYQFTQTGTYTVKLVARRYATDPDSAVKIVTRTVTVSAHEMDPYVSNNSSTHSSTCANCGYTITGSHHPVYTDIQSPLFHSVACLMCNYQNSAEYHLWSAWSPYDRHDHLRICTGCYRTFFQSHDSGFYTVDGCGSCGAVFLDYTTPNGIVTDEEILASIGLPEGTPVHRVLGTQKITDDTVIGWVVCKEGVILYVEDAAAEARWHSYATQENRAARLKMLNSDLFTVEQKAAYLQRGVYAFNEANGQVTFMDQINEATLIAEKQAEMELFKQYHLTH